MTADDPNIKRLLETPQLPGLGPDHKIPNKSPVTLPPGIPEPDLKCDKRTLAWMQYARTLVPNPSGRTSTVEKAPREVLNRLLGPQEKRYFFTLWLHFDKSWARVRLFEVALFERRRVQLRSWKWLTLGQLELLYNSKSVSEHIKAVKETSSECWRPHPEIPLCPEARQYLCQVDDEQQEKAEHIIRQGIELKSNLEKENGGQALVAQEFGRIMNTVEGSSNTTPALPANSGLPQLGLSEPRAQGGDNQQGGQTAEKHASIGALESIDELETTLQEAGNVDPKVLKAIQLGKKAAKAAEDREQKRQDLKNKAREIREKAKQSVVYRATDWVNKIKKHVTTCEDIMDKTAKNETSLPPASNTSYCHTFTSLKTSLNAYVTKFTEVGENNDEPRLVELAKTCSEEFVRFKAEHRTYTGLIRTYDRLAAKAQETNSDGKPGKTDD